MGNLLMIDGRAVDNDAWMMRSAEMIEVSAQILKAVDARDRARMEDLATELDESCSACHQKYMRGFGNPAAR
jgi:cytochrome c556